MTGTLRLAESAIAPAVRRLYAALLALLDGQATGSVYSVVTLPNPAVPDPPRPPGALAEPRLRSVLDEHGEEVPDGR